MKILRSDSVLSPDAPEVAIMADSVMRPDGRPLFLPEGEWECQIRPAIRIERLGKAIGEQFSSRYYSQFTAVNYLRSLDGKPWPDMIDDTVVVGDYQALSDRPRTFQFDTQSGDWLFDRPAFDRLLTALSQRTTFKTGDLIILPDVLMTYSPDVNMQVAVRVDGVPCLQFAIK